MRVVRGLNALKRPPTKSVVTIGMFDGVHVAHQCLIQITRRLAAQLGAASVVATFDPDPQEVLDPRHAQPPLMSLESRVRLIGALGVDLIWIIPFTRCFSGLSPERFVRSVLAQRLHALCVVVGKTFTFGRAQRGNALLLQTLGERYGMRVVVLEPVLRAGIPVSSSRIRHLIKHGKVEQAARLLGRPVELVGTVVRGEGRARRLGFPTANVRLVSQSLPPPGVYRVQLTHVGRCFGGLMNLGFRPTFGHGPLVCEVHLTGFNGNLYSQPVSIALMKRLRGERRFKSAQALAQQIKRDLTHLSASNRHRRRPS